MDIGKFAEKVEKIEKEDEDLRKIQKTASFLKNSNDQIEPAARFVQGRVFPAWDQKKLDIGPSLLYKSLSLSSGKKEKEVEEMVKEKGGIGKVAKSLETRQKTLTQEKITLQKLQEKLYEIAKAEGEGSETKKIRILSDIFSNSDPLASKYISRLTLGKMRIGVGEGTVRDAISEAFDVNVDLVERGLMVTNDSGRVAKVSKEKGNKGLKDLNIQIGRPIKPMLAQDGDMDSIMEDVSGENGEVIVEWKIDGARLQIHKNSENIELYSRRLEEVTEALPDIVELIQKEIKADNLILDSEVVAIDQETGEPLPFKEVLKRFRREYNIEEKREEINLDLYPFDILYKNSEELIDLSLRKRCEILDSTLSDNISTTKRLFTDNLDKIKEVESEALEKKHEGVMVKNPESSYTPGKRGKEWLKLKPEPETLDLVITGGEWGEGRRSGLIGSFLLSARENGELKTVGKVATGLTDEKLEEMTEKLKPLIIREDGKEIDFTPEIVVKVGFEEIQESPKYSSGYAVRFPRFLGLREDLGVEDSDTVERIQRLYEKY